MCSGRQSQNVCAILHSKTQVGQSVPVVDDASKTNSGKALLHMGTSALRRYVKKYDNN